MTRLSTFLGCAIMAFSTGAATAADYAVERAQTVASVPANDAGGKPATNGIYIVQFKTPPVARYTGGIKNLKATSPATLKTRRLDRNDASVKAYVEYLQQQRTQFNARLSTTLRRSVAPVFDYRYVLNGMAMRLSAAEAKKVAAMREVADVSADILYQQHTDAGPTFIGAPSLWDGSATLDGMGSQGEGVIIGIIDSGVNSDHPSFAEVGGDGYVHVNPNGDGVFTGRCGLPESDPLFFAGCNNKLIGAHDFVDALQAEEGNDGPEDENSHGSHTASTAGGNVVTAVVDAPTINLNVELSGVAPHANIIACDSCYTADDGRGFCPGAANTACADVLVADGVDAINYSISGGTNPWAESTSVAFFNATVAGVYVSASAGNSGPAAATVAHLEPWVGTTAASTHDGARTNEIVELSSDGAPLADIDGVSISAGYGPAPIVYAGDFPNPNDLGGDPAQCLQPYPADTFSGQIVVCDRGAIARVDKGQNVLAGGAGGFVLANVDAQGEGTVADPHFLPATHIGDASGDILRAWLAANSNTMATLTETQAGTIASFGDIMAGFSSRGPSSINGLLKPDVTAPGSGIFAAYANGAAPTAPEFGPLSGTSMSSPHHAGSGALMKGLFPTWTPYEIKSAIMMTGQSTGVRKEDGVTPTDPFDIGAGRVELSRAALTGLVLSESTANMQAANPAVGGDPATLNLASMQSNSCAGECGWSRTFTSVSDSSVTWSVSGNSGSGLAIAATPSSFTLAPGESQTVEVTAETSGAIDNAWNFGEIALTNDGGVHPALALPIAAFVSSSSNAALMTKSVSAAEADSGDLVSYTINVNNVAADQEFTVTDALPAGVNFVAGSESETVSGATTAAWEYDEASNSLSWSGALSGVGLSIGESPSPFGYVSLAGLGVAPAGCPGDCDDGGFLIDGLNFTYLGETYTDGIWSVNGVLELGTSSGIAASASNQNLPDAGAPDNVLAPFWTDMNLTDGGNWYNADLTGPDGTIYRVLSWEDVPRFNDPTIYSFQIWMVQGGSEFWFVYGQIPAIPAGLTVGFENSDATQGVSYFFNGAGAEPVVGTDLLGQGIAGGSAELSFDAVLSGEEGDLITNTVSVDGETLSGTALANTTLLAGDVDTDGDGLVNRLDNCSAVANPGQEDSNGDGYGNICDPDLDNNGVVNFLDIFLFSQAFQTTDADADFNSDGIVNFEDFAIVPGFFLLAPGPSNMNP